MIRVLLIEDDLNMQELISSYLQNYGYSVVCKASAKEALDSLQKEEYDIIILDLMLPDMDGFDVCKRVKSFSDIPIIISSARGDIGNKIMGYELGADDYLAKPYEPRELILKIEAILRRIKKGKSLKVADLEINQTSQSVIVDGYEVDLTKVEFEILYYLATHRGEIVSREQLINATSLHPDTKSRAIDMHISNIRHKIGDDSKNPKYIKSVWGIGYKFV